MIGSDIDDVIIMGSGIAGVAGASAAQELGVCPVVLEKARGDGLTAGAYGTSSSGCRSPGGRPVTWSGAGNRSL
jgi:glycine/D-amino acid oxidase-like deaminating enzyme